MSEFSKEYCGKYNPNFPSDFSYLEEFKKLEEGYLLNLICEGFGSVSVKKKYGICYLAFNTDINTVEWIKFDDVDNNTHKKVYINNN